jgi:hypothetical protein
VPVPKTLRSLTQLAIHYASHASSHISRHSFHFQLIGTICGFFWAELFHSLVRITNSCDKAGTIANELPIVEQIPVSGLILARL